MRRLWQALTGGWMALIIIASLLPPRVSEVSGPMWHLAGYAVLGALFGRWQPVWWAGLLAWSFGATVELLQWILPQRRAEVEDLIVNALGVIAGLVVDRTWTRLRRTTPLRE